MKSKNISILFISAVIFLTQQIIITQSFSESLGQSESKKDTVKIQKIKRMCDWYKKWFYSKAESITVEDLLKLKNKEPVVLIDNRSEKERKISIIPTAISMEEFERNKENYRNKKIVVYCTIGFRSGRYGQKLMKQGFDAFNLEGGILMWAHHKQILVNEDGKTVRVHVYGQKWSLLPEGYQAVY